jgi:hypothetical protein
MRDPDPAQRRAPVPEALIGDVEHLRRLDVALGQRRGADGPARRRGVAGSEHELTGIAAGGDAEGEPTAKRYCVRRYGRARIFHVGKRVMDCSFRL